MNPLQTSVCQARASPPGVRHAAQVVRAAACLLVVATMAFADDSATPPIPLGDRVTRLERNQYLIETLVENGLNLAATADPLERANRCTTVVERLADEILAAAEAKEADRIRELGQHYRRFLEQGVTENLKKARAGIPQGSHLERQLESVRKRADQRTEEIEIRLLSIEECGELRRDLSTARKSELQSILHPAGSSTKE